MGRLLVVPVPPVVLPVGPVQLSLNVVSSSEIDLTAAYMGPPNATTYFFQQAPSAAGPWTTIATQAGNFFANTGLTANTTYYYRAQVQVTDGRISTWSPVISGTTQAGAQVQPAATRTVKWDQAAGSWTPPGQGTSATNYQTIAAAIAAQGPGDRIRIFAGGSGSSAANPHVYTEQLNFKGAANGTQGNLIVWDVFWGDHVRLNPTFGFVATAYGAAGSGSPNGSWLASGAGLWGQGVIHFEGNNWIVVDARDSQNTVTGQLLEVGDPSVWNPNGTPTNPAQPFTYPYQHSLACVSSSNCQVRGVHIHGGKNYYAGYGGWDCGYWLFDNIWWDKHGTNNNYLTGSGALQAAGNMFDWFGHDSLFQYGKTTYCGHNTGPNVCGFNNKVRYWDYYQDWSAYSTGSTRSYGANSYAGSLNALVPVLPPPYPTISVGPTVFDYCRILGCGPGDVTAGTPYHGFVTANAIVRFCVYVGGQKGGHNLTELNLGNSTDTHTTLCVGNNQFFHLSALNLPGLSDCQDSGITANAHPQTFGLNRWQNLVLDGNTDNGLTRYLIYNLQATSFCGTNPFPLDNKGCQVWNVCINAPAASGATDSAGRVISRTLTWGSYHGGALHITYCDLTDAGHGSVPGAAATFPQDMGGSIFQQPVWLNKAAALQGGPTTGLVWNDLDAALKGMALDPNAPANANMIGTAKPACLVTVGGNNVTTITVNPPPAMFYDGRACPFDTPDSVAIIPAGGGAAQIVPLVAGSGVNVAAGTLEFQVGVTTAPGDKIYHVTRSGQPALNWGSQ